MRETRRYLGLELAGAKNQKTALAALEYYPREKKIFLLDIFDKIAGLREPQEDYASAPSHTHTPPASGPLSANGTFGVTLSGDEALLDLISELTDDANPGTVKMGVNVPLQLPPCIVCTRKSCSKPSACVVASVKWMREATRKAAKQARTDHSTTKVLEFTTYTQRPIELWIRYSVLNQLPASHRFEIDETLGGNKAPLTARMNFIQRHLGELPLVEVWPKLSVSLLALEMELSKRIIQSYRQLEEGVHSREKILDALVERHGIFIYERDVRKLSQSLPAFDAFICAYTALLSDTQRCAKVPSGFPTASGWVHYPQC